MDKTIVTVVVLVIGFGLGAMIHYFSTRPIEEEPAYITVGKEPCQARFSSDTAVHMVELGVLDWVVACEIAQKGIKE